MSVDVRQPNISVMIADDQPLLVEGLSRIINAESDMTVVSTASNGQEAIAKALATNPDVLLMDVRMPVVNGIEATHIIIDRRPSIQVVGLTSYDTDAYLVAMIQAGVSGFLLKDSSAERFIEAIRSVALGNKVFADNLLNYVKANTTVESIPYEQETAPAAACETDDNPIAITHTVEHDPDGSHSSEADAPIESDSSTTGSQLMKNLSKREQQVLLLVAEGCSNAAIEERLGISESTVKGHVGKLLNKLHARDRTALVIWAYRHGIVR
ncbi:response regulator transcription factor [Bifidobacterium oedipodis]|uniref:DNA-binding response regulator n=1 Tax=Bifidobacterium oedipodis TaxID=2675322 RepID=A0A7Y0HST9_9BIFI|nr:response regulator transcription factor [Bifidobacterium sp. DSM 109957]NMM94366.1 DNA-binding response regulator [Bifidobacterium sp. DSM 109957]